MPLVFGELGELFAAPELVEPLAPPAAVLQQAMQVAAGHLALHPAQPLFLAKRLKGLKGCGAAAMQLKAFDRAGLSGWPLGHSDALAQGFAAAKAGLQRQQIQPQVAPVMMVSLMVVMVFKTTLLELTVIGAVVVVVQLIIMDMLVMADSVVAEEDLHNPLVGQALAVRVG